MEGNVARVQAVHYLIARPVAARQHQDLRTGDWARVDGWLVKAVGMLVPVIGAAFLRAGVRGEVNAEDRSI
jgi:hypothetical protein